MNHKSSTYFEKKKQIHGTFPIAKLEGHMSNDPGGPSSKLLAPFFIGGVLR